MKKDFDLLDGLLDQLADRISARIVLPQTSAERELDQSGIAGVLGVSEPTIARMVRANEIPSYRVGKCRRFNRKAVLDYLQGGKDGKDTN